MADKKNYDVILEKVGNQQLKTTRAICQALGLGLAAAKAMVDKAPSTVATGLDKDKATALFKELDSLGNTVSVPGLELKIEAPAEKKTTTTKKSNTTKKSATKKTTPSPAKVSTPKNDEFDAIFGAEAQKNEIKPQSETPKKATVIEVEDCIEEVYEQDVDTYDEEFETMTDYYNACMDEESSLYNDGYGNLDNAVNNIGPFFQAVLNNLEERDLGTAQEFLAEIVQVDANVLNSATSDEGIFSGEEVQLFDLCECALKCAYNECLAEPNDLTETAMLHFAHYLYNEYSTLNDRCPSDLFKYYLDYYLETYGLEENIMWDIGALYFARLFVNDQQYSCIVEGESYYEIEKIYGEFLDELLEMEDMYITPNVQGRLYDTDFGYINAEYDEDEEEEGCEESNETEEENEGLFYDGFQSFMTEKGHAYIGYATDEGTPNGWGISYFSDGSIYEGFWKNGSMHGFGIYKDGDTIFVGNYKEGVLHGRGFDRSLSYPSGQGPISSLYYNNGNGVSSPDFGCREAGEFGIYSGDMWYFGNVDNSLKAHGWCCLWTSFREPQYYEEGIFEHGILKFGLRAWLYDDKSTKWEYGAFVRNSNGDYILNTTVERPMGCKGYFAYPNDKINLVYYDNGEFINGSLNGKGTRVYPDGHSFTGYFMNGELSRILSVVLPNGEQGDPAEFGRYLSYDYNCEKVWNRLLDMNTQEKQNFFAKCPVLVVPNGVKKISDYVFSKCENLKKVCFNEDLEEIGKDAFSWCKNIGPVLRIPNSVRRIGASAFSICFEIKTIYLPNNINVEKWGLMCGVRDVIFETDPPRGVELENGAFSECDVAMSKDMIRKIKDINRRAFKK
ncbi:MAG: hypothetical protein E7384_05575 [Ruminococcaceae bacterium]|nr:hypothetical protein [Oscillospiraceae bacterium]